MPSTSMYVRSGSSLPHNIRQVRGVAAYRGISRYDMKAICTPFLCMIFLRNSKHKTMAQSNAILQDIPISVCPVAQPS
jgi:hypothetical protein